MTEWTKLDEAQLTRLWNKGYTTAKIAKELGGIFTRNAVIGKAHRLGLCKRPNPVLFQQIIGRGLRKVNNTTEVVLEFSKTVKIVKTHAEKHKYKGFNLKDRGRKHHMTVRKEERNASIIETDGRMYGEGKTLRDLEKGECCWPIGEGAGVLFCSADVEKGAYCKNHASIAYTKRLKKDVTK